MARRRARRTFELHSRTHRKGTVMFTKVIVGVEGRQGDGDAIALARTLAPAGELVLVNAYPYDRVRARTALEGYEHLLRRDATELLERARSDSESGAAARLLAVADPSPGHALRTLAEEEAADLIVVGSCHRGPVGRAIMGDVSRATVHEAPCPVAVAPRGYAGAAAPPRVIGVAFDASPEARHALDGAVGLARDAHARLIVRTVVSPPAALSPAASYGFNWEGYARSRRREAREALDALVATLEVPAEAEVVVGSLGHELLELTARCDVVVVGSRGWGPMRRVALGSTSDWLVHHAQTPVVVVPRTPEQLTADEDALRDAMLSAQATASALP